MFSTENTRQKASEKRKEENIQSPYEDAMDFNYHCNTTIPGKSECAHEMFDFGARKGFGKRVRDYFVGWTIN